MNDIEKYCIQRKLELEQIIIQAKRDIETAPEGVLHVSGKGKSAQYYWKKPGEGNRRLYIRQSDKEVARKLAQKEYACKILEQAQKMLKTIEQLLKVEECKTFTHIYEHMADQKYILVMPYFVEDQVYGEEWERRMKEEKELKNKKLGYECIFNGEEEDAIITKKGEQVRSKSEVIIADKIHGMNIPYVYEAPLYLSGYGYIRPDLMALNTRTREVWYWEHLGMMDDPDYCEKAIRKIELYQKNGIFQGRGLILTFETSTHPLNTKVVDALIKEFLL